MHYLLKIIHELNLDGTYYTPENVIAEINKVIIGNPPFKNK